jgi:hypothetical protein
LHWQHEDWNSRKKQKVDTFCFLASHAMASTSSTSVGLTAFFTYFSSSIIALSIWMIERCSASINKAY